MQRTRPPIPDANVVFGPSPECARSRRKGAGGCSCHDSSALAAILPIIALKPNWGQSQFSEVAPGLGGGGWVGGWRAREKEKERCGGSLTAGTGAILVTGRWF